MLVLNLYKFMHDWIVNEHFFHWINTLSDSVVYSIKSKIDWGCKYEQPFEVWCH